MFRWTRNRCGLLLRQTDRCFGVGKSVRRALIKNEGLPEDRVEVIYNGVDLKPFAAVRDDNLLRAEMRAELGLNDQDFVVLQVARLNPLKDHLTAVRAIERFVESDQIRSGRRVHLLLAGEGERRGLNEQVIRDRTLEGHVTLLGARRDVPQLLAASDAFLLSSISEGIPLTLIEAMAAGVPVVSTDVGGIGEVVTDGETGLLAPTGDDTRLAAQLESLTDASLRNHLCARAIRVAEKRFSLKRMHSKYARVYRQLAGPTDKTISKTNCRAVQTTH